VACGWYKLRNPSARASGCARGGQRRCCRSAAEAQALEEQRRPYDGGEKPQRRWRSSTGALLAGCDRTASAAQAEEERRCHRRRNAGAPGCTLEAKEERRRHARWGMSLCRTVDGVVAAR